jgi:hypothetical protein
MEGQRLQDLFITTNKADLHTSQHLAYQTIDGSARYAWTYLRMQLRLHAVTTCSARLASSVLQHVHSVI